MDSLLLQMLPEISSISIDTTSKISIHIDEIIVIAIGILGGLVGVGLKYRVDKRTNTGLKLQQTEGFGKSIILGGLAGLSLSIATVADYAILNGYSLGMIFITSTGISKLVSK